MNAKDLAYNRKGNREESIRQADEVGRAIGDVIKLFKYFMRCQALKRETRVFIFAGMRKAQGWDTNSLEH